MKTTCWHKLPDKIGALKVCFIRPAFIALQFVVLAGLPPAVFGQEKNRLGDSGATIVEPRREIPITHRADVVIIGAGQGGLGGCTAAIAAARHGASALLIEESGAIGLHVPIALGVVIGINGWKPTIHEGIFREFAENVARTGQYHYQRVSPEEVLSRGEIIIRHHEVVSTAILSMLKEAGVQMVFHAKSSIPSPRVARSRRSFSKRRRGVMPWPARCSWIAPGWAMSLRKPERRCCARRHL